MFKTILSTSLVGLVAADCDGSPCQLLSVAQASRLESPEAEGDPVLTTNTFTAVDQCATGEVRDLTSWVLSYYEDVSNQLDVSFSNILTTARLANSALRYLGSLSAELQAFQRVQSISTEMNAMLRACMADAMHLSASMEKCDMSFSHDTVGPDTVTTQMEEGDDAAVNSVFLSPVSQSVNGTCLSALCEHKSAWEATCGSKTGFQGDLERIASAHDLEGSKYGFASSREASFHQPVNKLYSDGDDASNFAILNEDLFTQEYGLLQRVSQWIELQFNGMMVMVRKSLNGGAFAQASDLELCSSLGYPLDHISWLSLAFEKCGGSMVRTWLKVNPMNRKYMYQLVQALHDKIPNVIKEGTPGVLYAGMDTNLCAHFGSIEADVEREVKRLQAQNDAMQSASQSPEQKEANTFYLNSVSQIGNPGNQQPFTKNLDGNVQQWYMSPQFMKSPLGPGNLVEKNMMQQEQGEEQPTEDEEEVSE